MKVYVVESTCEDPWYKEFFGIYRNMDDMKKNISINYPTKKLIKEKDWVPGKYHYGDFTYIDYQIL